MSILLYYQHQNAKIKKLKVTVFDVSELIIKCTARKSNRFACENL